MARGDGTLRLRATLEPRGPAGAIVLSDDQVAGLGSGKTPPVQVTVNGVSAQARVARMGGENLIGFSKKLRSELGVEIGQTVDVIIALDASPRTVEVPSALADALAADTEAKAAFEALALTHKKEFARWVDEAKRAETRQWRVERTVQMLREGRTRS
jgi:hypothetical protein